MTIADEINRITGNIDNAYSALYDKGATMPATNNSALLADTINTISTGGGGYQEVGKYMIVNGVAQLQSGDIDNRFKGIVSINNSAMQSAFYSTGLSGEVNFKSLVIVDNNGLNNTFNNCKNITGINFSNLSIVNQSGMSNCFNNCSNLTGDTNFKSLTEVGILGMSHCFYNCRNLAKNTHINLCNLVNIGNNGFNRFMYGAANNSTINLSSLTRVGFAGMSEAFYSSPIVGTLELPNLISVGQNGMNLAFAYSNLTSVNIGNVIPSGNWCFNSAFIGSKNLTDVTIGSSNLSGSSISYSHFNYAFSDCSNIRNVSFPNLTDVGNSSLISAFINCNNIEKVELPLLKNVSNQGMQGCFVNKDNIIDLNLSSLQKVTNYGMSSCFQSCGGIETLDVSNLAEVTNGGMNSCFTTANLTSVVFNSLSNVGNFALRNCFAACPRLTSITFPELTTSSFGAYTNQFTDMLRGVNDCVVHFPASIEGTINTWTDVTSGFGGTNTTVLYDLGNDLGSGGEN